MGGTRPAQLIVGVGATITLETPYLDSDRLWIARVDLPQPVFTRLAVHGQPIRYGYVERPWPIAMYQNVYATEPGSAEMPSAGRPFTPEVITRLVAKGIVVSPLVLHTGVASLESTELPYPERARVPATTATRVNESRRNGGRVIRRRYHGRAGPQNRRRRARRRASVRWLDCDLVITPERGVHVVDGPADRLA